MATNKQGNTSGNIMNSGLAAFQGEWIYYRSTNKGILKKTYINGTNTTQLNDDSCLYINVVGEWVYYRNESDSMRLYKIKTDGSGRTKISDSTGHDIVVIGKWVYFSERATQKPDFKNSYYGYKNQTLDDGCLKRIRVDGKVETILCNESLYWFSMSGDWLYFRNENDDGKLYAMFIDGSCKTKICDEWASNIIEADDWVYYTSPTGFYSSLCKIRADGTGRSVLTDDCRYFNIVGEWVFYFSWRCNLYKMGVDGSEKSLLLEHKDKRGISYLKNDINVVGDWIHYEYSFECWDKCRGKFIDETEIYRIRTDGTLHQIVD